MGTIYFGCDCCNEVDAEAPVFRREELRLMAAGEWICQNCYDEAPSWTYVPLPPEPHDPDDEPRWHNMPMIPNYVPEQS